MTLFQIKFLINIDFILRFSFQMEEDIQNSEVVELIIENQFYSYLDIHLQSSAHTWHKNE